MAYFSSRVFPLSSIGDTDWSPGHHLQRDEPVVETNQNKSYLHWMMQFPSLSGPFEEVNKFILHGPIFPGAKDRKKVSKKSSTWLWSPKFKSWNNFCNELWGLHSTGKKKWLESHSPIKVSFEPLFTTFDRNFDLIIKITKSILLSYVKQWSLEIPDQYKLI